ncbi:hypothetical protein RHSIM_Rhsim11G0006700 [Rhododendron simsii]|uniref:Uncharacterized protein n=1 Tax=Rhododendron simsii TaxID=118357 RepID=A0A834G641_RHOSS|nr:hypothetical protein RHSIM_Rhsim11G0006700 [Rhododendron simsii]
MGRYDMVSMVHMQFLMAFCFEHFSSLAPSPADISKREEPRPRIMRWSGVSSTKSWGKRIDDADTFFLQPYAKPVEGALPTSFFSENDHTVDFQTEGITVSAFALVAFAAACPCSLPALCAEGTRSMLYRPDRVARQFGYDQGAPGQAPPLRNYVESLRHFTRAFLGELTECFNVVVLLKKDRETFFTVNGRLAWCRNLDSFINYVHDVPEIPAFSNVYHRDMSLRSPKARQLGWWGKKSYWDSSSTTPSASRSVTIAEPLSTVIPQRLTRETAKEKMSSQQQGPQLKRLRKSLNPFLSPRHEGTERTPSSKLKRKREDEEAREGGSDSSIDDTAPISQFFKLPRATQSSPSGTSVAAGKKVAVDPAEGEFDGTNGDAKGGAGRDSEEVDGSDADSSERGQSDEGGGDDDHSGEATTMKI